MSGNNSFYAEFSIIKQLRRDWPALLLLAASLVVAAAVYPQLPDQIPGHWNFRGEVDRYTSRAFGAFGFPLITLGLYILMVVVPYLDPKRDNYLKFSEVYQVLKVTLVCFLVGLHMTVLAAALGYPLPVDKIVPAGISLIFIITGNFMGRMRHNYFVGIKLPWTLASEKVWTKTHRLAGSIWVLAGLAGLVGTLFGGATGGVILFTALGIAVLVPAVYSFLLYKKIHNG